MKSVAKNILGLVQVQNHSTFEGTRRTRQFLFGYQLGSGQLPELRRSSMPGILLREFSEAGLELVTDDKTATWRLTREKEAELRGLIAKGWKRPFDPVAHLFAGLKARRTEIDAAMRARLVRDSWLDDGDLMDHIRRCRRDDARRRAVAVA